MIVLLVHPIMILFRPATSQRRLGTKAEKIPELTVSPEIMYQVSSRSANNGSAWTDRHNGGRSVTRTPLRNLCLGHCDSLVMIFSRYLPIIADRHGSDLGQKNLPFDLELCGTTRGDLRLSAPRYNCNHWRPFCFCLWRRYHLAETSVRFPLVANPEKVTCDGFCIKILPP